MGTETDGMVCRACGNEERASEGYPCEDCGTLVCLMCSMKGVARCRSCAEKAGVPLIPTDATGNGLSN